MGWWDINISSIGHEQSISSILGHSSKLLVCPCMGILIFLKYLLHSKQIPSDFLVKHVLHNSGASQETVQLT